MLAISLYHTYLTLKEEIKKKNIKVYFIHGTFRFANFTKPLPTLKDFVAKILSIIINKKTK